MKGNTKAKEEEKVKVISRLPGTGYLRELNEGIPPRRKP